MTVTKQELVAREADLTKQIDGGKLTGKALAKARMQRSNTRVRIKNFSGKPAKAPKVIAKQPKNPKVKPLGQHKQGILPGILAQMNPVHIEEMIADRIFKTVSGGKPLADVVGQISKEVSDQVTKNVLEIEKQRAVEAKAAQLAEIEAENKRAVEAKAEEVRKAKAKMIADAKRQKEEAEKVLAAALAETKAG